MYKNVLFILCVILTGCVDRPAGEASTILSPGKSMSAQSRGGRSDFDFDAGEDAWMRQSPEQRRKIREEFQKLVPRSGLRPGAVALIQEPLPGGALALAIRDPALPNPRIVVISEQRLEDAALLMGATALGTDEQHTPQILSRRVLRVHADGRVIEEGGSEIFRINTASVPSGVRGPHVTRLERMADSASNIQLPGIGVGRILYF